MTSRDTTAREREAQLEVLRTLGGARRLEQALRMSEEARRISLAGMLSRSPGMSVEEARSCVLRRVLGPDVYGSAYSGESFEGEYCGRCHGKVAFPPQTGCPRCHVGLLAPAG